MCTEPQTTDAAHKFLLDIYQLAAQRWYKRKTLEWYQRNGGVRG